jgi:hypothetical protein
MMTTCPKGHENPEQYRFCGQCGVPVVPPMSPEVAQPQGYSHQGGPPPLAVPSQGDARRHSQRGWRAWPRGVRVATIAAVPLALTLLVTVVALSRNASSRTKGSLSDWESSVCAKGPTQKGRGALPNADSVSECFSPHGNPILIGTYSSRTALDIDVRAVPYDAPYATLTDGSSGSTWMFVSFEASNPGEDMRRALDPNYRPTAPSALSPLVDFGFRMHHVGK